MELIRTLRHGRFTIRCHGQRAPDGRHMPVFVIQEGDDEIHTFACPPCDGEHQAAEIAMAAGLAWFDEHYPGTRLL